MSTTPMQRPFLVGPNVAGSHSVRRDSAGGPVASHGLYLVPFHNRKKKRSNAFQADSYKFVAVAAALFLILTI